MRPCKLSPGKGSVKWFIPLAGLVVAALCLSLFTGSRSLSLARLWEQLLQGDSLGVEYRIFLHSRLPRTVAALAAGSALAVSGGIIQAVLHNPLAGPNVIGVNAGAGFCALLCACLFPTAYLLTPLAAFFGALCTSLVIYGVAARTGASRITLVLAGVAVSGILSAGMDTLTLLFPDQVIGATGFLVGSFSGVTLSSLQPAGWMIVIGIILALLGAYHLNVLSLGDEIAAGLGMRVKGARLFFIATAALLAGSAVSIAGLLGFVGLMVPHISRRFIGGDHRLLLPFSALLGAVFALVCDALGKLLFAPYELPVGILLSFLGGPFFLFLLLRQRGGEDRD